MTRFVGRASAVAAALLIGAAPGPSSAGKPPAPPQPNIVFILTDDLSANLTPYMDEVLAMQADGVTFDQFIASDSLCCPSRASIFTGEYPHNHGVISNHWPLGGFGQFMAHDHLDASLNTYLHDAGYRTGLFGKYLNEYSLAGDQNGGKSPDYPPGYVPPGWDEWFVTDRGYDNFRYAALHSIDGSATVDVYGIEPDDYLTDTIAAHATDFIDRNSGEPFFLMLSTFAPHRSESDSNDPQQPEGYWFPPAPRDRAASPNRPASWAEPEFADGDCSEPVDGGCASITYPAPEQANFNVIPTNPPAWLPQQPLTAADVDQTRVAFIQRVQMVQAVDDLIGDVRAELAAQGLADDTYVVFGSDNGFHLGEHALPFGKKTAYDHDVRVPFVVVPPGSKASWVTPAVASNIDVLPTFLDLAGVAVPPTVDGESVAPQVLSRGAEQPTRAVLIEHTADGDDLTFRQDPDAGESGHEPPDYLAVRTPDYLYVDYSALDDEPPGARQGELYWLATDPYETDNGWPLLSTADRAALNSYLNDFASCAGEECRVVGAHPPAVTPAG